MASVAGSSMSEKLGRALFVCGGLVLGSMLASCASSSTSSPTPVSDSSSNSDDYPDFSKPLTSAMDQLTDEDAQKMQAQLSALGRQRRAGAISQAEYNRRVEELRKLAQPGPPQS